MLMLTVLESPIYTLPFTLVVAAAAAKPPLTYASPPVLDALDVLVGDPPVKYALPALAVVEPEVATPPETYTLPPVPETALLLFPPDKYRSAYHVELVVPGLIVISPGPATELVASPDLIVIGPENPDAADPLAILISPEAGLERERVYPE